VLGLEEVLYLGEGEELRDVVGVLGGDDALPAGVVLEGLLALLLVGDLGVVQQEPLQQEVPDLEHVHLRPAAGHLQGRAFLVLGDPVLGAALHEHARLRQGQSHLPRQFLPLEQLVDEVEVGFLVVQGVVGLRVAVLVAVDIDVKVGLETHPFA
jgi:hypothetical protein